MSKHTEGPWNLSITERAAYIRGKGGKYVMQYGFSTVKNAVIEERIANARLIAAAPKMLAELKEILAWHRIESTPLRAQELESIAAVIAQATGEN